MTWNRQSVKQKVLDVFKTHNVLGVEITEASEVVADLGIDSLGVMELLADIEDAFKEGSFKPEIPDDALRDINTVGDVVSAVAARLEKDGRLAE